MTTITEGLHARMSLNIVDYLAKLKRAKAETRAMAATAMDTGRKIQTHIGGGMTKAANIVRAGGRRINRTLDSVRRKLSVVRGAFSGIKGAVLGLGAALGLSLGLAAVVASAKGMSKAASDFEETAAKFHAVFKEFSADSEAWVDRFTSAVGRSKGEVMAWMARLQDTFVPLGFARDRAAELSAQITTLGVDLASFNNMVDADVIENLTSAITGQHIAVRKYGIVLNEAALNQQLWNMGISGGVRGATNLEKVQARLNVIMSATTDAQGDAIRTAHSFENQMKFVHSAIEDVRVELGTELNKEILNFINAAGGAVGVAAKLKIVLRAVIEIAKIGVQLFVSWAESLHKWQEAAGGATAAGLRMASSMKRVEVGLRFIGHIIILIKQGLIILGHTVIDIGKLIWTVMKTVGRLLATGVLLAVVAIGKAVGKVVQALTWLSDLLGISDDAATELDHFLVSMNNLEETAQGLITGLKGDWDDFSDSVSRSRKLFNQYAKDQEASWKGVKKASQEVMDLTVQAEAAQKDYNTARKAASALADTTKEMNLKVRLSEEMKIAKERVKTLKESLRDRILALKDYQKDEERVYKEALNKYKDMLSQAQKAYSIHIGRLNSLDREHLQFNESIEERVFRLRTKNLAPDAQIQALRSAVREFESRAGGQLRQGNFEESRRLLDKASSFLEEMASIDPSAEMAEKVASDLERMQEAVNQIFKDEGKFHTKSAQEALVKQEELKRLMDNLTAKQEAWAEQYKATMLAWERLGDANEEQLKGFKEDLDEATKKRSVFIEAATDQAHAALRALQADIDALHGKSIDIQIRRSVETPGEKPQAFDRGGQVRGQLGKAVPVVAHAGEYIVNRAAARNYLPFLRSINQQGLGAPQSNTPAPTPVQGGESFTMGDVNVTLQSSGDASVDAVEVGNAIYREIRRGRVHKLG